MSKISLGAFLNEDISKMFLTKEFLARPKMNETMKSYLGGKSVKIENPENFLALDQRFILKRKVSKVYKWVILNFKLKFSRDFKVRFTHAAVQIDQAFKSSVMSLVEEQYQKKHSQPPQQPSETTSNLSLEDQDSFNFIKKILALYRAKIKEKDLKIDEERASLQKLKAEIGILTDFQRSELESALKIKGMILEHARAYQKTPKKERFGGLYLQSVYDLGPMKKLLNQHYTFDFENVDEEILRYSLEINKHRKKMDQVRAVEILEKRIEDLLKEKKIYLELKQEQLAAKEEIEKKYGLASSREQKKVLNALKKEAERFIPEINLYNVLTKIYQSIDLEELSPDAKASQRSAQFENLKKSVQTSVLTMGGIAKPEESQQKMALVIYTLSNALCESHNNEKLNHLLVGIFETILDLSNVSGDEKETVLKFIRSVFSIDPMTQQPFMDEGYRLRCLLFLFASGITLSHYFFDIKSAEPVLQNIKMLEGGSKWQQLLLGGGKLLFNGKINQLTQTILNVPFLKTDVLLQQQAKQFIKTFIPIGEALLFSALDESKLKRKMHVALQDFATIRYKRFMDKVSFEQLFSTDEMTNACIDLFSCFKNISMV
ncbi:hypothetical protein [Parachlamydia acanthamoebae]|uniref:Uncharacterized protein n=2 Tax=Parachlamydia acanthamoebae TaxID=83552 RepID=F8KW81_PARAV|nr:hypothetical protein [Parachlamydia acanthamoebae]KIA78376.1 hypothetical protein DB43_EC00040 [Parachlamydia acanthamoebae]CCB85873.1 putative uncharacterized protein [Parachlamydia acanthamoebae UV-7]